jgi:hypothetical protein
MIRFEQLKGHKSHLEQNLSNLAIGFIIGFTVCILI